MTRLGANAVRRWRVLLFALLALTPIVVLVASVPADHMLDEAPIDLIGIAAYGGIGGLVIFRRDGNLVGWLLLALGATMMSVSRLEAFPGISPSLSGWISSVGWPLLFALFAALTLVFPSGHLPMGHGRWERIGRAVGRGLLPLLLLLTTLSSGADVAAANPWTFFPGWVWYPAWIGLVLTLMGGAISLVVRRRHTSGVERAQLGWVVMPLTLLAISVLVAAVWSLIPYLSGGEDPGDGVWLGAYLAMLSFPVAFGVAVLRYRLYEIDRIISRTITYGLVTAAIVAAYWGAVFVLGTLLPREGEWAVAVSTLLAAALFNPLRTRIQRVVDRRFNRSRFDAERLVDELSRRLSAELDLAELAQDLQGVVLQTMQPTSVAMWVRDGRGSMSPTA